MIPCETCQPIYDGWLTRINAPWRGKCWKCLTQDGLCAKCVSSLAAHRAEQRALVRHQLDGITKHCKENHDLSTHHHDPGSDYEAGSESEDGEVINAVRVVEL